MCNTVCNKLYIFNICMGFSTVFYSVNAYDKNHSIQLVISYSINKFQYFIVKFWCVYAIQSAIQLAVMHVYTTFIVSPNWVSCFIFLINMLLPNLTKLMHLQQTKTVNFICSTMSNLSQDKEFCRQLIFMDSWINLYPQN